MSLLYVSLTFTSLLSYSHFSVIRLFLYPHVSSHIHMSLLYVSFHIHMSLLYVSFCIHMSHLHVSFLFYLITHDAPSLLYVSLPFICLFYTSLYHSYVSFIRLFTIHMSLWHSYVSFIFIRLCSFTSIRLTFMCLSIIRVSISSPCTSWSFKFESYVYEKRRRMLTKRDVYEMCVICLPHHPAREPPSFLSISFTFICLSYTSFYLTTLHMTLLPFYTSLFVFICLFNIYVSLLYEFLPHHPAHDPPSLWFRSVP